MYTDALTRRAVRHEGVWLELERCRDCQCHALTTRHREEKYRSYESQVRLQMGKAFGNRYAIEVNPGPIAKGTRFRQIKFSKDLFQAWSIASGLPSRTTVRYPRLGAFEVFVCLGGERHEVFSKLATQRWPNVEHLVTIVGEVANFLEAHSASEAGGSLDLSRLTLQRPRSEPVLKRSQCRLPDLSASFDGDNEAEMLSSPGPASSSSRLARGRKHAVDLEGSFSNLSTTAPSTRASSRAASSTRTCSMVASASELRLQSRPASASERRGNRANQSNDAPLRPSSVTAISRSSASAKTQNLVPLQLCPRTSQQANQGSPGDVTPLSGKSLVPLQTSSTGLAWPESADPSPTARTPNYIGITVSACEEAAASEEEEAKEVEAVAKIERKGSAAEMPTPIQKEAAAVVEADQRLAAEAAEKVEEVRVAAQAEEKAGVSAAYAPRTQEERCGTEEYMSNSGFEGSCDGHLVAEAVAKAEEEREAQFAAAGLEQQRQAAVVAARVEEATAATVRAQNMHLALEQVAPVGKTPPVTAEVISRAEADQNFTQAEAQTGETSAPVSGAQERFANEEHNTSHSDFEDVCDDHVATEVVANAQEEREVRNATSSLEDQRSAAAPTATLEDATPVTGQAQNRCLASEEVQTIFKTEREYLASDTNAQNDVAAVVAAEEPRVIAEGISGAENKQSEVQVAAPARETTAAVSAPQNSFATEEYIRPNSSFEEQSNDDVLIAEAVVKPEDERESQCSAARSEEQRPAADPMARAEDITAAADEAQNAHSASEAIATAANAERETNAQKEAAEVLETYKPHSPAEVFAKAEEDRLEAQAAARTRQNSAPFSQDGSATNEYMSASGFEEESGDESSAAESAVKEEEKRSAVAKVAEENKAVAAKAEESFEAAEALSNAEEEQPGSEFAVKARENSNPMVLGSTYKEEGYEAEESFEAAEALSNAEEEQPGAEVAVKAGENSNPIVLGSTYKEEGYTELSEVEASPLIPERQPSTSTSSSDAGATGSHRGADEEAHLAKVEQTVVVQNDASDISSEEHFEELSESKADEPPGAADALSNAEEEQPGSEFAVKTGEDANPMVVSSTSKEEDCTELSEAEVEQTFVAQKDAPVAISEEEHFEELSGSKVEPGSPSRSSGLLELGLSDKSSSSGGDEGLDEAQAKLEICVGARVRLQGLQAVGYNGKVGVVQAFFPHSDRWRVKLEDGELRNLKSENLVVEALPKEEDEKVAGSQARNLKEDGNLKSNSQKRVSSNGSIVMNKNDRLAAATSAQVGEEVPAGATVEGRRDEEDAPEKTNSRKSLRSLASMVCEENERRSSAASAQCEREVVAEVRVEEDRVEEDAPEKTDSRKSLRSLASMVCEENERLASVASDQRKKEALAQVKADEERVEEDAPVIKTSSKRSLRSFASMVWEENERSASVASAHSELGKEVGTAFESVEEQEYFAETKGESGEEDAIVKNGRKRVSSIGSMVMNENGRLAVATSAQVGEKVAAGATVEGKRDEEDAPEKTDNRKSLRSLASMVCEENERRASAASAQRERDPHAEEAVGTASQSLEELGMHKTTSKRSLRSLASVVWDERARLEAGVPAEAEEGDPQNVAEDAKENYSAVASPWFGKRQEKLFNGLVDGDAISDSSFEDVAESNKTKVTSKATQEHVVETQQGERKPSAGALLVPREVESTPAALDSMSHSSFEEDPRD